MSLPLNSLPEHHSAQAHARYNMIEQQIRPWNVLDEEVLALLGKVHRENFVPPEHAGLAFMDLEIPWSPRPRKPPPRAGACWPCASSPACCRT